MSVIELRTMEIICSNLPKIADALERIAAALEAEVAKTSTEANECVICHKHYTGFGNNADPISEGQCCDECNMKFVVPARLHNMVNKDKE